MPHPGSAVIYRPSSDGAIVSLFEDPQIGMLVDMPLPISGWWIFLKMGVNDSRTSKDPMRTSSFMIVS